ncbi:MAG: M20/M25/M40 family metallo-hydrolase [Thermorudis peleae]|nr:M20/M25/M40 family metallo-hydrolase [Thermorudis peleae]
MMRGIERWTPEQQTRIRERAAELAEAICRIPAPTFAEQERGHFVAAEFARRGLAVEVDELGNVIARRPGSGTAPTLLLAAHLDTVFTDVTAITVTRDGMLLRGPGIGDNSLGIAALLVLAELLDELGITTPGELILAANVGEEGLGNLRGIRGLVDRFADQLGGVIAVEGHNFGRVTHVAVGSRRYRVIVQTPGGHSWGAFGSPSAIHVLARIIVDLTAVTVPQQPKTTYNVGLIEGGVSVNTIAPHASAVVDLRSVDPHELTKLATRFEDLALRQATDRVQVKLELLGERPAGRTPPESPLVRTAIAVLRELGREPILDASSTDANIPIARGIPAICIGITTGQGSHTLEEQIDLEPVPLGIQQLVELVRRFPVSSGLQD